MASDFHTHDLAAAGRALVSAPAPIPGKLVSLEAHPWKMTADFGLPSDFAAQLAECAALGEVGYDGLRGDAARQLELLPELLGLAWKAHKPVVLHLVRPTEAVFSILDRYPLKYLVHGFRGRAERLRNYLERGYFVSLGSRALRDPGAAEFLKKRGLERIGFETDAGEEDIRDVLKLASAALERSDLEQVTDATFDEFLSGGTR